MKTLIPLIILLSSPSFLSVEIECPIPDPRLQRGEGVGEIRMEFPEELPSTGEYLVVLKFPELTSKFAFFSPESDVPMELEMVPERWSTEVRAKFSRRPSFFKVKIAAGYETIPKDECLVEYEVFFMKSLMERGEVKCLAGVFGERPRVEASLSFSLLEKSEDSIRGVIRLENTGNTLLSFDKIVGKVDGAEVLSVNRGKTSSDTEFVIYSMSEQYYLYPRERIEYEIILRPLSNEFSVHLSLDSTNSKDVDGLKFSKTFVIPEEKRNATTREERNRIELNITQFGRKKQCKEEKSEVADLFLITLTLVFVLSLVTSWRLIYRRRPSYSSVSLLL